ncbi:DUF4817 domain-containing protein [Trichonephila clavipes]|nr:DUF4817 domain-containing protein [Trichonephila clavipes]
MDRRTAKLYISKIPVEPLYRGLSYIQVPGARFRRVGGALSREVGEMIEHLTFKQRLRFWREFLDESKKEKKRKYHGRYLGWNVFGNDEAHFWLNSYVNKQNCRIWSEANPQVYVETPLHPEKLTVWCSLWAGGIIGPYFFKNDEGHNVTVNGDRYRAMITNFFIPELNNHDVQ